MNRRTLAEFPGAVRNAIGIPLAIAYLRLWLWRHKLRTVTGFRPKPEEQAMADAMPILFAFLLMIYAFKGSRAAHGEGEFPAAPALEEHPMPLGPVKVLIFFIASAKREEVIEHLLEEWQGTATALGPRWATVWLWKETARSILPAAAFKIRTWFGVLELLRLLRK